MAVKGYVRVSSKDQNEQRQVEKFKALGIEQRRIFIDKASGKNFDRPEYQAMKRGLEEGDLLYIDSLDRLGRNYDEVIKEWKEITRKWKADIVVLDQESLFDSRKFRAMGDIGKLLEDQMLSLLSYVADAERQKIRQRQREGIDIALKEGKQFGRPRTFAVDDKFKELHSRCEAGELKAVEVMRLLDIGKTTYYAMIKELNGNKRTPERNKKA